MKGTAHIRMESPTYVCEHCNHEYVCWYVVRPGPEEYDTETQFWLMDGDKMFCPNCGKPGKNNNDTRI